MAACMRSFGPHGVVDLLNRLYCVAGSPTPHPTPYPKNPSFFSTSHWAPSNEEFCGHHLPLAKPVPLWSQYPAPPFRNSTTTGWPNDTPRGRMALASDQGGLIWNEVDAL